MIIYVAGALTNTDEVISSQEGYDTHAEAMDASIEYVQDLNDILEGMGEDRILRPYVIRPY